MPCVHIPYTLITRKVEITTNQEGLRGGRGNLRAFLRLCKGLRLPVYQLGAKEAFLELLGALVGPCWKRGLTG